MKARKPRTQRDRMPQWLRPRLQRAQVLDLAIVHVTNVDEISSGKATEQTLWDMATCVLTWSRVAEVLDVGVPEIEPQLHLVASLIERYGRTGVVSFEGAEYELAKFGIVVMDLLAQAVDATTAERAVAWANDKANRWCAAMAGARAVAQRPRGLTPNDRRFFVVDVATGAGA